MKSTFKWYNLIILIFIITFLNACASVNKDARSNAIRTTADSGCTVSTEYPVKVADVLPEKKGLTIGLANIKNYLCLQNHYKSIEFNKEKILIVIDQLKKYNVNIIVFPEFSLTGYFWADEGQNDSKECWEYMKTGVINNQREWLKQLKSKLDDNLQYIIINTIRDNPKTVNESALNKKFLNSTYIIDKAFDCDDFSKVEITHIYDKTFLPGIEKIYTTTPKKDYLVINTNWGNFGFTTCYDMCFSQLYQEYALDQGDLHGIFQLASWRGTGSGNFGKRTYNLECKDCNNCEKKPCNIVNDKYWGFQWDIMISDRAATNQIWMIGTNAVGWQEIGKYDFWGGSGVWAPSGIALVQASNKKEELLVIRNLQIQEQITREQDAFYFKTDFEQIYEPILDSDRCSFKDCGSYTRFAIPKL